MLSDLAVRLIRTLVPAAVGSLLAYLATRFPGVAETIRQVAPEGALDEVYAALVWACIGLYYSVATALEQRWPQLGWLLGAAKQPVYLSHRND